MRSPWQRAIGGLAESLDPGLREYFDAIPRGYVGRGVGVFDVVGTPRRWLWPVLRLLAADGVLAPTWSRNVPFSVENRPTEWGTIQAIRHFSLPNGDFVMVDETGMTRQGLADRLGFRGSVVARLHARVVDGHLELRSTGASLFGIPLGPFAPVLTLIERTAPSSALGRQHVSLTLDAPLIGRIYEYSGSFNYTVQEDTSV